MNPLLAPSDVSPVATDLVGMGANLGVALLCGIVLSRLYRFTNRGTTYSFTLDRSLITLALITALVIAVVGNNLARAFGLVGAMSIVRFRTALKDPQDLVFIFFSLTVGLAAGVGLHAIAVLGTACIGGVLFVMSRVDYGVAAQHEFVLQLALDGRGDPAAAPPWTPVFARHCRTHRLLGARATDGGDALDLTFHVSLTAQQQVGELTRALAALPRVTNVTMFHDDEPP